MEESLKQMKMSTGHEANVAPEKRKLDKAKRLRKYRELFWRKGSKMLPEFFPLDAQPTVFNNQSDKILLRLVNQYTCREKDEQSETQIIAEWWMAYFGFQPHDFAKGRV